MSIDLDPEDLKSAEALVAQGRFASVQEAVGAGLRSLSANTQSVPWTPDLHQAIEKGVQAANAHDFATDTDLDALFAIYQQQSA